MRYKFNGIQFYLSRCTFNSLINQMQHACEHIITSILVCDNCNSAHRRSCCKFMKVVYSYINFKVQNMSNRGCRNHPDIFCYICGQYTLIRARNAIDGFVKKAYITYFGIHIR